MSGLNILRRSFLIGAGLTVLLLVFGATAALAADSSSPIPYNNDNYSEGFSSFYPHDCWRGFEMIYYKENVWQAFYKGDGPAKDEIAVYVSKTPATATPPSKPTHYRVVEPNQTWSSTDRRINNTRFAIFNDRLYLYNAKTYDDGTGMILWQKQIDPISPANVSGTRWNPPGTNVWEYRPKDAKNPRVVSGLIVKVLTSPDPADEGAEKIYILFQYSKTSDVYLITSLDAVHFTKPEKITTTFSAKDCLLNGEVIARGSDGKPLIAFVTKDDATGGDNSTGTMKLWTFDPATRLVSAVSTLPEKYRDMTLLAGDVAGCTPYDVKALQLWGVGWGSSNLYHMQFVFNADGKSGALNPPGIVNAGSVSPHVEQANRRYLASCVAPELTNTPTNNSLQQYGRVWWWGSTDVGDAHGRSLKYKMDTLKKLDTKTVDMSPEEYNGAWILQGVIYGMPPFYNNGVAVGGRYLFNKLSFGLSASAEVGNKLVSDKTLTLSYNKDITIKGHSAASMGYSFTNSVQQSSEQTKEVTLSSKLSWAPDDLGDDGLVKEASQAWGVFLIPTITNERYELLRPDGQTLGAFVYYTYISGGGNLIAKVFDKTNIANTNSTAGQNYWKGIQTYPNSLDYRNPQWTGPETNLPQAGDDDYEHILAPVFWTAVKGSGTKTWDLSGEATNTTSQTSTNTIDMSRTVLGFGTEMKGSVSIGSTTSTTFGAEVSMLYGIPGTTPSLPDYLSEIDLYMYLLRARSANAFWIPEGAKIGGVANEPWCMTWHVNYWRGADGQQSAPRTLLGNIRMDLAASLPLPSGIRTALIAKLTAARAAYDRGKTGAVLNILRATRNQIRAQSGKAIPADMAERWTHLLDLAGMQIGQ